MRLLVITTRQPFSLWMLIISTVYFFQDYFGFWSLTWFHIWCFGQLYKSSCHECAAYAAPKRGRAFLISLFLNV